MKKVKMKLILVLCFLLPSLAFGQDNKLTVQNIFNIESVAEVALSPDKSHIAYVVNVPRPFTDEAGGDYRELHVYNLQTRESIPFITGNRSVFSINWTPDGKAVTFRANFPDLPGVQVYAINLKGGESYPLTQHTASINDYAFIDANTLAITSLSAEDPMRRYLRGRGFNIDVYEEEYRHRNLYRYDLNTHQTRQLTHDVTVFDFTLSPDRKMAAAAIAPRNLVDDSYMFKRIYTIDMETGEMLLLMDNPGKLANMAWSPDGKKLAFRASSKLEDSVEGSLFVTEVPSTKSFSALRNYVQGMELSVIDFAWKDNNTLLYAAEEGVDIVLSEQRIDRPDRSILLEGGKAVFNRFHHVDGLVAFAGSTWQHPSELFSFEIRRKNLNRHTTHNKWLTDIKLSQQRKLVYNARDGKDIEGVLIYPLNFEQGKQYPLIVYIHGGPEAAVKNGWVTSYGTWGQVAGARDYFVFMPNYRASSGRGVDFTMVGYGDLVGVEYDDVLDGIDHLINIGYVDADRVGMGGGSYGGYFSAWSATKHTDRFAASVVFVGISNQISKRNTTDIPWEDYYVHWGYWTHENWEDVYSRSPVKYAHQSKTPTLVLHGAEDPRVHPSQGLELYRALKLHGSAPVRMIWYNGEGHGNRMNVHRLDYIVRTMDWFDYYLKSDKPKDRMPEKYPDYGIFD
ncbi:MAG: S9 family peptidase [Bacteroidetes bacterium]|nr:MAG: S9 family peptidase [Bacteroidota bacterium]